MSRYKCTKCGEPHYSSAGPESINNNRCTVNGCGGDLAPAGDKPPKVDVHVHQKPVAVCFYCEECEDDVSIPYDEFLKKYGAPCDWTYTHINCPNGHQAIVEDWTFE
jgi:hypothetical protein